jgi:uncharacterized membrane protein YGL010W
MVSPLISNREALNAAVHDICVILTFIIEHCCWKSLIMTVMRYILALVSILTVISYVAFHFLADLLFGFLYGTVCHLFSCTALSRDQCYQIYYL